MSQSPPGSRRRFARWLATTNDITQHIVAVHDPACINLSGGLPAPELYPLPAIAAASKRAVERLGAQAVAYGPIHGLPQLRAAIAARLSTPAQRIGVENVLVTTGSLQALELMGKVMLDPGDRLVAQFPTYLGALDAWRPREPRYGRFDWHASETELEATLAEARFVYAVPNFSNPTGVLVPADARAKLLRAVRRCDVPLIEDDPYGALFYDGTAPPSLLSLGRSDNSADIYRGPVVHLGTLSKTIAPGLRVGWAIAEPEMIEALSLAKQGTDLGSSSLAQAVALELLEADVDRENVPRLLATYRARRDAIVAAAQRHLGEWFEFTPPTGGMFLWLVARDASFDSDAAWQAALDAGVSYCPSSVFDPEGRLKHALRLNFTLNDEARLELGVKRLADAIARYWKRRGVR